MSDSASKNLVNSLADNLGSIFKYVLPGFVILALLGRYQPGWILFKELNLWKTNQLLVLVAAACTFGTGWYVCHRFIVLELFNRLIFRMWRYSPLSVDSNCPYSRAHALLACARSRAEENLPGYSKRLAFRISLSDFAFIVTEAMVILPVVSKCGNTWNRGDVILPLVGAMGFFGAIYNNILNTEMEIHLATHAPGDSHHLEPPQLVTAPTNPPTSDLLPRP